MVGLYFKWLYNISNNLIVEKAIQWKHNRHRMIKFILFLCPIGTNPISSAKVGVVAVAGRTLGILPALSVVSTRRFANAITHQVPLLVTLETLTTMGVFLAYLLQAHAGHAGAQLDREIHYGDVLMGTIASQITGFHDCLLNRLFRRRSKKISKLRVTGLCAGNSPGTGEFPAQMASNAENVLIWWRHHDNK